MCMHARTHTHAHTHTRTHTHTHTHACMHTHARTHTTFAVTATLTSDNDEGIRGGEDAAAVVERLAGVGPSIFRPGVPDGQCTTTIHAGDSHTTAGGDVAPVETPDDERGGHAHSLAVDGESPVDLHLYLWCRGLDDGRNRWEQSHRQWSREWNWSHRGRASAGYKSHRQRSREWNWSHRGRASAG